MNGHMILKCFSKEKCDFWRAVMSSNRTYFIITFLGQFECLIYGQSKDIYIGINMALSI